jgi:hypothetical protein
VRVFIEKRGGIANLPAGQQGKLFCQKQLDNSALKKQ